MNHSRYTLLGFWLALALAALPMARAQTETPPPAPAQSPSPEELPKPTEEETQAPVEPKTPAEEPDADPESASGDKVEASEDDDEMRELGVPESSAKKKSSKKGNVRIRTRGGNTEPRVGDQVIARDAIQTEAVTIVGNTTVDGHVRDAAVSIVGNTVVNGRVDGEAVAVLGSVTVNGTVGGEAVAVFGDIILGKDAVINGEAIAVFGKVVRGEGSKVRGGVQQIGGLGHFGDFTWLRTWIEQCAMRLRPLGFGEGLGWAWGVAGAFLIFYMVLALLFPRGIERCAEALELHPGKTVLASLLTMLALPVITILLAITGIGLALIPVVFLAGLFGKAAILAWFGRRVLVGVKDGFLRHPVVAVLIGGLIVGLLYVIPVLGFLFMKLLGMLGIGMVVYAMIIALNNRPKPVPARPAIMPVQPVPPGAYVPPAATMSGVVAPSTTSEQPLRDASGGAIPPPPPASSYAQNPMATPIISAATLTRASFWPRLGAAVLDIIMVAIVVGLIDGMVGFDMSAGFMLWLAIYHVVMWTKKGTTIGGVICGLKVVRLDDRPLDWGVSIVRAMSAFLSLAVAGLGFIWVAFDDERQSWHDKIAGTTIVKVPKGTALL